MSQYAIGCPDIHAQIEKFWNTFSNSNFKENLIKKEIKYFFCHQPWCGRIRQLGQSLDLWTWSMPCAAQILILY